MFLIYSITARLLTIVMNEQDVVNFHNYCFQKRPTRENTLT